jgi:hypothetical protein
MTTGQSWGYAIAFAIFMAISWLMPSWLPKLNAWAARVRADPPISMRVYPSPWSGTPMYSETFPDMEACQQRREAIVARALMQGSSIPALYCEPTHPWISRAIAEMVTYSYEVPAPSGGSPEKKSTRRRYNPETGEMEPITEPSAPEQPATHRYNPETGKIDPVP